MNFVKMHGLGNDFVVIEDFSLSLKNIDRLARELCERNFGVGADGLVLLHPSEKAQFRMRIINADGSEAEMCGNALRCVGKYLYEKGLTRETAISVEMFNTVKTLRLEVSGNKVASVEVDMGEPILESDLVPVVGARRRVVNEEILAAGESFLITAVSIGNPHCVIFCDDTSAVPLDVWGPALEAHEMFPKKTNVEFVEVVSPEKARFRVWERGVGQTLACGSGACAVLVVGVITSRLSRKAILCLPGGELTIHWRENNRLYMSGPATEVFTGELAVDSEFAQKYLQRGE
ncbi:MAG: diaminopimelate epimerase [Dethiobacter sp.]